VGRHPDAYRHQKIGLTNTCVLSGNDTPEAFFDGYRRLGDSSEVSDDAVHLGLGLEAAAAGLTSAAQIVPTIHLRRDIINVPVSQGKQLLEEMDAVSRRQRRPAIPRCI
jgi:hypothetical protein